MRTVIIAALLLSVVACGRPTEEVEAAPPNNWADYTIVHTCASGREIYRDPRDQGMMIWNTGGFFVELDRAATIEGVCGEAPAIAGLDESAIAG
jgi:hypothetical protein